MFLLVVLNLMRDECAKAVSNSVRVQGDGLSSAAVGRPSTFTITLLDKFGKQTAKGGEASRLTVFASPPPLGGFVKVYSLYVSWVRRCLPID